MSFWEGFRQGFNGRVIAWTVLGVLAVCAGQGIWKLLTR